MEVNSESKSSEKNLNNDSVSLLSRVLREEVCSWGGNDLVDSLKDGEIRDDSVLDNDGCRLDCGKVTTDDNEDVRQLLLLKYGLLHCASSTPPGNDLNMLFSHGSSWI
ncbi:hypothetical protein Tco_0344707 [Tanacetum coccineum]